MNEEKQINQSFNNAEEAVQGTPPATPVEGSSLINTRPKNTRTKYIIAGLSVSIMVIAGTLFMLRRESVPIFVEPMDRELWSELSQSINATAHRMYTGGDFSLEEVMKYWNGQINQIQSYDDRAYLTNLKVLFLLFHTDRRATQESLDILSEIDISRLTDEQTKFNILTTLTGIYVTIGDQDMKQQYRDKIRNTTWSITIPGITPIDESDVIIEEGAYNS